MNIYAIGDLHLTQDESKSMEKFGWANYDKEIFRSWEEKVQPEDLVLIAGDISWAMKMEEAVKDLERIHNQKGKKVLVKGNHDYWWSSITKLNNLFDDMFFIQNNVYETEKHCICGSRLWTSPNVHSFTDHDLKLYKRELQRLENSLRIGEKTEKEIIALTHYPPTNESLEKREIVDLYRKYDVKHVIYGHLHGDTAHSNCLKGEHEGINYHLVACDYLDFQIKYITSE